MRRRRVALAILLLAALLTGELHCARTAADAPATEPEEPPTEPPPADEPPPPPADDQQAASPPPAPGPAPPPPPRRHRRTPPPKQGQGQGQDPAPPRLVIPPPREAGGGGGAMNRSTLLGCSTLLVFGDSTVDPGNNNHLQTTARANFLPYGVNFFGSRPTGRFTNGRLATDMIAERLGIGRTIPGFLDPNLRLVQLRRGVSFASGGSGYDDNTASRLNAMSMSAQVRNLFRYKLLIRTLLGPRRAERLVNRATFVISTGTNDMLAAYLLSSNTNNNRSSSSSVTTAAYQNYLIARVANHTQVMSMLGGRRFLFVGLPPMGCLPIVRTLMGTGSGRCDANLNQLALSFNSKLLQLLNIINAGSGNQIRASYIDAYTIINDATNDPNKFGLSEVARGCCGSGVIEISQTCRGRRTCGDPNRYLYWDAIHPTQRTNQLVADAMMGSIRQLYTS